MYLDQILPKRLHGHFKRSLQCKQENVGRVRYLVHYLRMHMKTFTLGLLKRSLDLIPLIYIGSEFQSLLQYIARLFVPRDHVVNNAKKVECCDFTKKIALEFSLSLHYTVVNLQTWEYIIC